MNIGVTGATGFIGTYLLAYLGQNRKLQLKALTRTLSHEIETCGGHITWLKGDLNSPADCAEFISDLDIVIHLAHTNTPLTSNRDLAGDAQANLVPSLNFLQAVKESGRSIHIVYASSGGAVYGYISDSQRQPFKEIDACFPSTSYGIQKLSLEHYLRMLATEGKINATVIRIGNPYGVLLPPQRMQGFIGVALYQIMHEQPIKIIGNPENVRDYIHLDDVCSFFERILSSPNGFQIYNLGSGKGHSVNELIEIFEIIAKRKIVQEVLCYPESDKHLIPWIVLSMEKAEHELDWMPRISLMEGIHRLYHSITAI